MRFTICLALLSLFTLAPSSLLAGNWPQLRGPHGNGTAEAKNLPTELNPEKTLRWKVALPGHSAATPAIWGDHIFLMAPDGGEIYLLALDANGKEQWRRQLGGGNQKLGWNGKNNLTTPSPATDGQHVWALAGSGDLWCFDFAGNEVWHKNLFKEFGAYETGFGVGFSPLLYQGALYIPFLHQKESFILALDANTGDLKWKSPRVTDAEEESKDAYSTACVVEYPDRAEIVICGADLANAYDAQSGKEVWRHGDINPKDNKTLRIVVSPVTDGQRIVVSSAKGGPVHAIAAGAKGDVTSGKPHLWTCNKDTPDVPTPAMHDGLVYMLRENGVMTVLDATTGEPAYHERVASRAGAFSPSPVVADGKVYLASEGGAVVVLAAGREFKKLGENELGELIMATPVVAGDAVYIRGEKHLYCFANP